jgi:predicted AAA+ superfamily ATPase
MDTVIRASRKKLLPQFRFLVFLLSYPKEEFSAREMCDQSGINIQAVYRYINQAEQLGMVKQISARRSWVRTKRPGSIIGGMIHYERLYRRTFKLVILDGPLP